MTQSVLAIDSLYTIDQLTSTSIDSKILFVYKYVGSAAINTQFTLNFAISGTNAGSYYFSSSSTILEISTSSGIS